MCSGKGFLFADRGEFVAKGFEEPVRVYEVRWREWVMLACPVASGGPTPRSLRQDALGCRASAVRLRMTPLRVWGSARVYEVQWRD